MLENLFAPAAPNIISTKEQTVLTARTRFLGAMFFCTIAFLVFFVAEFKNTSAKLGIEIWWVTFALGSVSAFIGLSRLRDTRPLMIITAQGLAFPRLFTDVLAWAAIKEIKFSGSFLTINFVNDQRLKWYPKFTLVPGDPGFAGDGFFSKHEIPWVRVRINYLWPVNTATLRKLIGGRRP